jgi:beta-glucosidase
MIRRAPGPCLLLTLTAAGLLTGCSFLTTTLPYQNPKLAIDSRVDDLLARMTPDEKLDMFSGAGWMDTRANTRLGIPAIHMTDGPMGIRSWAFPGEPDTPSTPKSVAATAFPAGIAMAATWNPELVTEQGRVLGRQALALGRDQLLGPTVNIQRTPLWGRNFESYGEDPWLTSRMAVAWISGVQEQGVIATVKHFAVNNQEFRRNTLNVLITDRALEEIYLPAFRASVEEAGVWSVMSSYNKVNSSWAAENPVLLNDILKRKWGFRGFVVSDWAGTHSTADSLNSGLDLEMPGAVVMPALQKLFQAFPGGNPGFDGGYLTKEKLKPLVASGTVAAGKISALTIDDSLRRILRAMFGSGIFDRTRTTGGKVDTPEQREVARVAAVQSIVLLKNENNTLPILKTAVRSIAVIGSSADAVPPAGGGSSLVTPANTSKPLDAIRARAGNDFKVEFRQGGPAAVELAKRSDLAIIFAGNTAEVEAGMFDRKTLSLPAGQNELLAAVAKVNKRTIVVLNVGAPVVMQPWLALAPAVLNAWFPGEEGPSAIASVLFGDANPSGKLPVTFPKRIEDTAAFGNYPGVNDQVSYDEGIYVGYRHFDKHKIEPLFPFGHGLSYTTFEYSDLRIYPQTPRTDQLIQVMLKLKNSGPRAGAEVVQLYLRDVQASVDRPLKELKAFRRVELQPGETRDLSFTLDQRALSFFDPLAKEWTSEPGEFEVLVGSSSSDIKLKRGFELFP